MNNYAINVAQVEECQDTNNINALENIFVRAKSAIVNGAKVLLIRKETSGKSAKFDEMDTLEDLEKYKEQVFKYLS